MAAAGQETTETVYTFIREFVETHGYAPSQREIARGCFLSQTAVRRHIGRLRAAGRITAEPGRRRTIRIVP